MNGYELEVRKNLLPDGAWEYFRYFSEADKSVAISYRDAANKVHPDRWRITPLSERKEEQTTVKMVTVAIRGEPLP